MSNSITIKDLVLVYKSGEFESRYGRQEWLKNYTFYDQANKSMITVIGSADLKIRLFSICEAEFRSNKPDSWNLSKNWDKHIVKNLMGAGIIPTRPLSVCNNNNLPPKIKGGKAKYIESYDQYTRTYRNIFKFADVTFYDGFIKTADDLTFRSNDFEEHTAFMSYFNQINKPEDPIKGGFEVDGQLEISMRRDSISGQWGVASRFNSHNSKLDVISYDLEGVKLAKQRIERDRSYTLLVAWARRLLEQDKKAINPQELEAKAKSLGLTNINADDLLESVTFKADYQKKFFSFLKGLAKDIYYSKDGFFFVMKNDKIIWEMPKYGASTYVFDAQNTDILIDRIRETPRSAIYADDTVGSVLSYIGRRRHPHEDQNGEYEENWQNDVKELAGIE